MTRSLPHSIVGTEKIRPDVSSQNVVSHTTAFEEFGSLQRMAQEQAQRVLNKIPLLGPVTWLMLQQPTGRHTLVGELEWRVLPALMLDQVKLYLNGTAPVAYASWAMLSAAVAERYCRAPHQLGAKDWNSGDQIWLIDVLAPFGGAKDVLEDLRNKVFAGRKLHQLIPIETGRSKVITWPEANAVD